MLDHNQVLAAMIKDIRIDPISLEFKHKPQIWKKAKTLAGSMSWTEAYHNELKSLKEMGVYKLIPRSEVPHSHKVRKGQLVFKI